MRQEQSGDDSSGSYIDSGLPVLLTLAAGAVSSVAAAFAGSAASPSLPTPQRPAQGSGNVSNPTPVRRKPEDGNESPNSNNTQTSGDGDGGNHNSEHATQEGTTSHNSDLANNQTTTNQPEIFKPIILANSTTVITTDPNAGDGTMSDARVDYSGYSETDSQNGVVRPVIPENNNSNNQVETVQDSKKDEKKPIETKPPVEGKTAERGETVKPQTIQVPKLKSDQIFDPKKGLIVESETPATTFMSATERENLENRVKEKYTDGIPLNQKLVYYTDNNGEINFKLVTLDAYKIKSGDSLDKIAKDNKVNKDDLIRINGLDPTKKIPSEQNLFLPPRSPNADFTTTESAFNIIKEFELRAEESSDGKYPQTFEIDESGKIIHNVYPDSNGNLTVGYGMSLKDPFNEESKRRYSELIQDYKNTGETKISDEEALELYNSYMQEIHFRINNLIKVPLTQNQFDALASFMHNRGGMPSKGNPKFQQLYDLINDFKFNEAAKYLEKFDTNAGLARRRKEEAKLFLKK